jgi:hypothetical protein
MTQTNKLEAIRVKLKSWDNPDLETLVLFFEKVQTHITSRDFTKAKFPVSVFTDFGNLEITLKGNKVGDKNKNESWLNEYIDNDQLFIEEEVENDLTFWDGEDNQRYDWSTAYSLSFTSKSVRDIPLNSEEWKKRYVEMTLDWERLYHERQDLLQKDFLQSFVSRVKGQINNTLPDNPNQELIQFKGYLTNGLDELIEYFDRQISEMEEFYSNKIIEPIDEKKQIEIQTEVNNNLKSFWRKLIDKIQK